MKETTIRAVIWDIGGVLVRTVDVGPRRRLAERLGISHDELVYLVFDSEIGRQAQLGLVSPRRIWEHVCQVLGLPFQEIPVLEREFFGGDRLDTALVDYIRSLRPRYRTGIISNAWDDVRQVIQERWRIADAFDSIVISAEVKLSKPDPRIFQVALQELDVQPFESAFIDDFPQNVEAARSVGMHALQFRSPEQIRLDLEQLLNGK